MKYKIAFISDTGTSGRAKESAELFVGFIVPIDNKYEKM